MVFPRFFFALCALFLFVAIGGIHAEAQTDSAELTDTEVHLFNTFVAQQNVEIEESALEKSNYWIMSIILEIIKDDKHCVMGAIRQCKKHQTNPSALRVCAVEYFKANKVKGCWKA